MKYEIFENCILGWFRWSKELLYYFKNFTNKTKLYRLSWTTADKQSYELFYQIKNDKKMMFIILIIPMNLLENVKCYSALK